MYKVAIIKADLLTSKVGKNALDTKLNEFYLQNPNVRIENIEYWVTNYDDYTAIITYEVTK